MNQLRASRGVAPLVVTNELNAKAKWQAGAMAAAGSLFHSNLASGQSAGWHTLGENVAMGLGNQQELSEPEIETRVHEALELVDLPNVEHRFPAELSGGMRKRVGIARAIALRPKYILYDEPTTGLDPVTSAVIDQLMVRMRDKLGVTSIVITHDMRSAYTVGTRIAMLYEGRVRQVGTVDEIQHTTDPVVRQFIDGRPDIEPEAELPARSGV